MTNEIKEILEDLETEYPSLTRKLRDYITNLQEKVEQYENPDDMTLFYMWLDEKAKDKMKQLQEENKRLQDRNIELVLERDRLKEKNILNEEDKKWFIEKTAQAEVDSKYKSRNEKAIEYIKNNCEVTKSYYPYIDLRYIDIKTLLNILEGVDKE